MPLKARLLKLEAKHKVKYTPHVFYVMFGENEDVLVYNDPNKTKITWDEYKTIETDQVLELL